MNLPEKQTCLIMCSKNPFLPSSPNYFDFPSYIIEWLIGKQHHFGEIKKGRQLGVFEGNNVTNYIAYLMGLSHGEVLDIIEDLKKEKLL
jgi:hypothetical protein